jgi:L-fuculose-phosphate aldolase
VGKTLGEAFAAAENAEFLAEIYLKTRCVGKPRCLDDDQVDRLKNLFENYGRNNGVE